MWTRRRCLAAGLSGAGAALAPLLPSAACAAALADVLSRPAAAVRLSSKPAMARITRAGRRLVAVGERGLVLLSDDDGHQWRQARVPVSVSLTGVQFIDAQRGWAIGHAATVLQTGDGGESWALQFDGRQVADGLEKPLLDLHFSNDRQGWAVGAFGLALQTDDGGRHWQSRAERLPNPKGLHLYALAQQGQRLFMAGEQGLFLSVDAGGPSAAVDDANDSTTALATPYRGSYFALAALPDGALLLGGLRGTVLLRTAAGDFRPVDSGTAQAIVSITSLSPQRPAPGTEPGLALVDQSGRLLLGTAGAGRFTPQPAQADRRWVAVATANDGSLVGAASTGVWRIDTAPQRKSS